MIHRLLFRTTETLAVLIPKAIEIEIEKRE